MPRGDKHTLWLMPEGELRERLDALIGALSRHFLAPKFEPHITLLGGLNGPVVELTRRTEVLAQALGPVEVNLTRIEYMDDYYRCLYVLADPSRELLDMRARAQEVMASLAGRSGDMDFMPHLSLLYGDFEPSVKEEVIRDIGREFNVAMEARRLYLYRTEGEPPEWEQVASFPLGEPHDPGV